MTDSWESKTMYRSAWSFGREKSQSQVLDFLTYSRETGFSFSYEEVEALLGLIGASNEIDRVSKFDNSLSFGAKQNALRQIFFALWFFQDFQLECDMTNRPTDRQTELVIEVLWRT